MLKKILLEFDPIKNIYNNKKIFIIIKNIYNNKKIFIIIKNIYNNKKYL
jgi:hypothetical protein